MVEKGPDESRARYVWDREKLAWVEAVEESPREKTPPEEIVADIMQEEGLEDISAEVAKAGTEEELQESELEYRGAWIRLAAIAIDALIIVIINAPIRLILGTESPIISWLMPIVGAGYFIGFWAWRGQTLGKMVIGAKIVRPDGSPISLARSFLRYLVYFAYLLIARLLGGQYYIIVVMVLIALLTIAFSREKRGLHDRIAGTVVINTRPKPLEDYEEEEGYEEEYEGAYEAEEEVEASEES